MSAASFTDAENWTGGFYELAIELGARDDSRLMRALSAVWALPGVDGPYPARDVARERQQRAELTLDQPGHLAGVATLPSGEVVVCGTTVLRYENGSDWATLYVPLGSLARVESRIGSYPFGDYGDSLVWRRPLDDWLATLAERIYAEVAFPFAFVGFEMLDELDAARLGGEPPAVRTDGVLLSSPSGLRYYPATREQQPPPIA